MKQIKLIGICRYIYAIINEENEEERKKEKKTPPHRNAEKPKIVETMRGVAVRKIHNIFHRNQSIYQKQFSGQLFKCCFVC